MCALNFKCCDIDDSWADNDEVEFELDNFAGMNDRAVVCEDSCPCGVVLNRLSLDAEVDLRLCG